MNLEYTFGKILPDDIEKMLVLAAENGGNKNWTREKIEHWYFNNPSNSYSMWKVDANGKMEGYATTNNFYYKINNKRSLVAMSQNVLTSVMVRGKGLFRNLYFKTETENIEDNKAAYFLTFTNVMSTPVFLDKLGYVRGKCPVLLISFFNPLSFIQQKEVERLESINEVKWDSFFQFENAMEKSLSYFKWRYAIYTDNELHIISVSNQGSLIGYAFLLVKTKKGIKYMVFTDVICRRTVDIASIIKASRYYVSKKLFLFMLMFEIPSEKSNYGISLRIKDRFNFLVKGKTPAETEMLSDRQFSLFLGDLDII